jgi:hypothetical protein
MSIMVGYLLQYVLEADAILLLVPGYINRSSSAFLGTYQVKMTKVCKSENFPHCPSDAVPVALIFPKEHPHLVCAFCKNTPAGHNVLYIEPLVSSSTSESHI